LIPLFTTNLFEGEEGSGLRRRNAGAGLDSLRRSQSRACWRRSKKGKSGEVYNLGGGNGTPNLEIVRELLRQTGRDESLIQYVRRPAGARSRVSYQSQQGHARVGMEADRGLQNRG